MHVDEPFVNAGEMGRQIAAFDWSSTSLGPVSDWPLSLTTAVRIMLQCQLPMYIAWGPEFTQLYNDAYRPILGDKHPAALGASARDTWHEIWPVIGPMWEEVWQGRSFGFDNFKLTINRYGYSEDCYFNYSYSPVPGDDGQAAGILVTFVETTSSVLAQRRQSFLLKASQSLRDFSAPQDIMRAASGLLAEGLGVARVGYGEVDAATSQVHVVDDCTEAGMPSLAGQHFVLDDFGPATVAVLRSGQVLCMPDVATDARSLAHTAAYGALGAQALVVIPIIKDGVFEALLYLHEPQPRQWRPDEVQLAVDIAEQTWHAVIRARAQAISRENQEHLRHTVELNPDVHWTTSADGRIERISARWHEWTGTDGTGSGWLDGVHPDYTSIIASAWSAAVATGSNYDMECPVLMGTEGYKWIRARAYPQRDASGAIVRWYGTTQDIHAFKLALVTIEQRDKEFRTLAETMPNQAWLADGAGNLYWFNQRVHEYAAGLTDVLEGTGWTVMVHPDDVAHTMASWTAALQGGLPYENEFRLRHGPTGEYRWFIARALPVKDENTGTVRWIGTNTDVHAQKTVSAELARVNQLLELEVSQRAADCDRMWRLTTDIMLVAEFDATIVSINPAWHAMLGWTEAELLGRSFLDLVHPDDVPATIDEAGKLSRGVKTLHFQNRYRHSDGSYRWLDWTAVPDDSFIHAVARDITPDKEQQHALEQAQMALRQSQKLESIGKLTGGVAHDFNNILQVISGSLQLLQRYMGGNSAAELRLAAAMRAVERGAKLSTQLLAFARRQPLQPTAVNPGALLRDMDDLLRRALGEAIEMRSVVAPQGWDLLADQGQLENVILNLAINARDAMKQGGCITIETSNTRIRKADAALYGEVQPGDYVKLTVADTGTGMAPDVLEQACEPFFTTKPEGEGTGLGLSMAYGFVKQSGGHFKLHSELGVGTTVTMYFPRTRVAAEPVADLVAMSAQGGDETILVVEDDADVQTTVIGMLAELGYRVLKADHAEAAMVILRSGIPVDLLFTDVVMPGRLSSPDMAREAKRLQPAIAVLFTSGYPRSAMAEGAQLDPSVQLISKPYPREQLAKKIRHCLANARQAALALTPDTALALAPDAALGTAPPAAAGRRILVVEDVAESRQLFCDMLTLLGHHPRGAADAEAGLALLAQEHFDALLTDYELPGMSGSDLARLAKASHPALEVLFLTGYGATFQADLPFAYRVLAKPCDVSRLAAAFA